MRAEGHSGLSPWVIFSTPVFPPTESRYLQRIPGKKKETNLDRDRGRGSACEGVAFRHLRWPSV